MNVRCCTNSPAASSLARRLEWQDFFSLGASFGLLELTLAWGLVFAVETASNAADSAQLVGLFRTGKYAECVEATTKAITESDFNESYRLLKLRSELELGRYADAAETLDAALKKFSRSIELRWWGREVFRFNNQPDRVIQLDEEITRLLQQSPSWYSDAGSRLIVGRFLLGQGADPKKVLDGAYNIVKRQQPTFAPAFVASGELALAKNDFALAAQNFEQAVKLDATDADAHFGLAQAFAASDSEKAEGALKTALERNPNHVGCLLLIVDGHIDSERYNDADTLLTVVDSINPQHPRAATYRAVLAHLRNQPEREKAQREGALKHWPANPEVDHLLGKKLSQKYRFSEGAAYQRQALEFDPKYLPAKMQLASDLLRLGEEEEGWRLANEVYATDGYNVVAHNLVTLQESVSKFRTLEEGGIVARMEAREADIYGRRVLELLKRAKRVLGTKYDVTIDAPVIVEMFPKQEDFAIRTFGLPGGAGFLGVCFGTVITANSPASQDAHPTCWEATLWHEFCHVITLHKTHNKMPRWLSEGISVYEERQADPTWGQSINPQYRKMLLGDELTPVSELSGEFLHPRSPQHLQFAYFESSLVVEYLVEKHGLETLQKILVDLGNGVTINDALTRHVGAVEELDVAFAEHARKLATEMAPEADWSQPELPRRADTTLVAAYLKDHPHNYAALQRIAKQFISEKKWVEAKQPLETMRRLYPQDASNDGHYALLAKVHRELKEIPQERAAWEKLAELSDDNVDLFARLTELASQAGDWQETRKHALRWLAVSPLQPAPHRIAAEVGEKLKDQRLEIDSYRALLLLNPIDPAEIHLRLATALQRSGDLVTAKRHALLALEEAPRFRAAHRRLLEIIQASESPANKTDSSAKPAKQTGSDKPAF
jgi:tetratricopeptide (TPR) repeat protein